MIMMIKNFLFAIVALLFTASIRKLNPNDVVPQGPERQFQAAFNSG